jgi:hypothetical protein
VSLDIDGLRTHAVRGALGGKYVEEAIDLLLGCIAHLDRRGTVRSFDLVRTAHRDHAVLVFHVFSSLHAGVPEMYSQR